MKIAIKAINYVCVLLLLAVMMTQFSPFWSCSDCKTHEEDRVISIVEYTWFPEHHKPITKGMTDVYLAEYGQDYKGDNGKNYKFAVDDVIVTCAIVLISGALGTVLCLVFSKHASVSLFPLICGFAGVSGYLSSPALKIGINYNLHVILLIVTAVVALAGVIIGLVDWVKRRGHFFSILPVIKWLRFSVSHSNQAQQ